MGWMGVGVGVGNRRKTRRERRSVYLGAFEYELAALVA